MTFNAEKKSAHNGATLNNQANYTIENRIMQLIESGEYIKRYELVEAVGCCDVRVREGIATLQMEGKPIINLQDGRGYKLASNQAELDAYKMQEAARARQILKKIRLMNLEG